MHSMTGFGRGAASGAGMEISVELASVNRRGFEVALSGPKEWASLERAITERLRKDVHRGRVQVTLAAQEGAEAEGMQWDSAAVKATLTKLEELSREAGLVFKPDMDVLFRVVQAHKISTEAVSLEDIEPVVLQALEEALEKFLEMRQQEGKALADDLRQRNERLKQLVVEIREHSGDTVARYRELLFNRLKQSGLELDPSDERVLREIALFADRCDISEELTRLDSHLEQFGATIDAAREAESAADSVVGRKLEFLVQEINREVNTIGSKANNLEITQRVLEAKNEFERIREQVQNVE